MMRRLGMNVIQEGVETSEQLDLVLDAGANLIQGYYFSKPLREKEFVDFVRNFNEHPKRF
jgi:EAL domain-containing protein (putative c-di-GMP-specific phosphodiesterase class I)